MRIEFKVAMRVGSSDPSMRSALSLIVIELRLSASAQLDKSIVIRYVVPFIKHTQDRVTCSHIHVTSINLYISTAVLK